MVFGEIDEDGFYYVSTELSREVRGVERATGLGSKEAMRLHHSYSGATPEHKCL